jgi:hypothetical protein
MVLPSATWLPAHLIAAANPGSSQAEVTVYVTPAFVNGGGGGGGGGDGGGGGGGGGAAGVTPVLDVVTEKGRFTEDIIAKSDDRKAELYIPKDTIGLNRVGQLISSILVKVTEDAPAAPADSEYIGHVYRFGPDGVTFDLPVDLTIKYDESKIPEGVAEKNLVVAWWDKSTSNWVDLESTVYLEDDKVTAKVSHFSLFTILVHTRPAGFTIDDLSVTPEEVNLGESISISVLVTNTGDLTGSYEVSLEIDNVVAQIKEVTLDGHDSKTLTFQTVLEVAGEHNISIGTESRLLQVEKPLARTAFTISDLSISPREVNTKENVTIRVTVSNIGDLPGAYELPLKLDGYVIDTKEVFLNGKESCQVRFILSRDTPGAYTVSCDDHLFGLFRVYARSAVPETSVIWPSTTPVEPSVDPAGPVEQPAIPVSISLRIITSVIAAGLIGGIGLTFVIRLRRYYKHNV